MHEAFRALELDSEDFRGTEKNLHSGLEFPVKRSAMKLVGKLQICAFEGWCWCGI